MAKVFGSGMDSVRLLVDTDDSPSKGEGSAVAGCQSLRFRMRYLRRVYYVLCIQFTLISFVCFILHMTPGVRPFIQEHRFPLPLTTIGVLVTLFALKKCMRNPFVNFVCLVAFTVALLALILVISALFDTESGYQITALIAIVFLFHALYCLQSLKDLNVVGAIIVSFFIALLASLFIQVFLSLIFYDYAFNIFITMLFTSYAHINVRYFLFRYTFQESYLGCISVFTSLCPPYRK